MHGRETIRTSCQKNEDVIACLEMSSACIRYLCWLCWQAENQARQELPFRWHAHTGDILYIDGLLRSCAAKLGLSLSMSQTLESMATAHRNSPLLPDKAVARYLEADRAHGIGRFCGVLLRVRSGEFHNLVGLRLKTKETEKT